MIEQDDIQNALAVRGSSQVYTGNMPALYGDDRDIQILGEWVRDAYQRGVEAIIETGRRLSEVRRQFEGADGRWSRFIGRDGWAAEGNLPFKKSQITKLLAIYEQFGQPPKVGLVAYVPPVEAPVHQLPANISSLAALAGIKKKNPDRFTELVETRVVNPDMRPNEANAESRKIRKAQDEARVLSIQPTQGRFRTLVLDPPWEETENFMGRAAPDYATMNQAQLIAMRDQVRAWLEPESHVYLWTINNRILDAHELVDAWGLDLKALVTWCKPYFGLGSTFRNATEHFLFCTTGGLGGRATDIPTWFLAAPSRTEHSAKPKEFYDIVRRMSYPPFGECYQRSGEMDFQNVYEQV